MRIDNRVLLRTEISGSKFGQSHRFLEVGWFCVDSEEIVSNKEKFEVFCKSGCGNYGNNGGCPPYAPDFARIQKVYRNGVVIWVRCATEEFPDGLLDKADKNFYFVAQYAQAVLPPVIGHIRKLSKGLWKPDLILGESACKKCNPCVFNEKKLELADRTPIEIKRKTLKCRHPKERLYSLESTGIDVDLIMRLGAFPIHWYPTGVPVRETPYTVKAILLLYRGGTPEIDFTQGICDMLNKRTGWNAIKFGENFDN